MTIPGNTQISGQYGALYRSTVAEAAKAGHQLMGKLVAALQWSLAERGKNVGRDFRERDQLAESRELLAKFKGELCARYPDALLAAFADAASTDKAAPMAAVTAGEVRFDQLELMDEGQVNESVEMARSQQVAVLAADAALADLNTLICATLGLKTVRPERNPLRPDVYVKALQTVISGLQVPAGIRSDWMRHMCVALGVELRAFYGDLSGHLRNQGVVSAGYAVLQTPSAGAGASIRGGTAKAQQAPPAAPETPATDSRAAPADRDAARPGAESSPRRGATAQVPDKAFLTLDKLRRLLAGELDSQEPAKPVESFAARFAREFDGATDKISAPPSDFHPTVPAAFEALKEMKQVDQVMQRIEHRQGLEPGDNPTGAATRDGMRRRVRQQANGLGQALSLEVVMLMIDNITQDQRLLEPVAQVVRSLEPALLRLALVDPRFFSDKQHPARRLLQEITHRSLAYQAVDTKGFAGFLDPLQQAVKTLDGAQIGNAEPFELVLKGLLEIWDARSRHDSQQIEKAVDALRNAEARNLLAETLALEIRARPDAALVGPEILEFLCGPWVQVVAQARLSDQAGAQDPGQFAELISVLLWSAQPALTRKNVAELTRLVPKLLAKLREGLATIQYPTVKTSAFFETLMNFHQQAFRPAGSEASAATEVPKQPASMAERLNLRDDADPWLAPLEAKASGFMEMPMDAAAPQSPARGPQADPATGMAAEAVESDDQPLLPTNASLPIGAWVELQVNGRWTRTQLTWASPHGSLFLFTSSFGTTQSMTRRSRDKLFAAGSMRLISGQPVVDGALDAVAQTAMLNSITHELSESKS